MDAGVVVAGDNSSMSGCATAFGDDRAAVLLTATGSKEAPCRESRVPIDFDQQRIFLRGDLESGLL